MEVFQDNIRGDVEDQRRIRIDPMDIVQRLDYRAVNLWFAHGIPQLAATAETTPMEQRVDAAEAITTREYHEREQLRRGDHPHDHGRYIQPPLVHSVRSPIVASWRTVHIDLPAWGYCPPLTEIVRVVIVFQTKRGESLGYAAEPHDDLRRGYAVDLPTEEYEPGWIPADTYGVQVLVWITGETEPHRWTPTVNDQKAGERGMTVEVVDEPRRPSTTERQAA